MWYSCTPGVCVVFMQSFNLLCEGLASGFKSLFTYFYREEVLLPINMPLQFDMALPRFFIKNGPHIHT